jgi:hypothetical protein
MWDTRAREALVARIGKLTPDARPAWGRMTCPQMVVHVTDAFALYVGEIEVAPKKTPLQYPPLKQAFVYLLPIPRNVPTARELMSRTPGEWNDEVERLRAAVRKFCERTERDWPAHPVFGRLTRRGWGALAYKHTDHHLRQFGV